MDSKSDLLANADQCVKCGLCLAYCPTYIKTRDENESPRGRISLIQAWANQSLPGSDKLLSHIDNCLLCRSCERVCPAMVPYGSLIDKFRGATNEKSKSTLSVSLLKLLSHRNRLRSIAGAVINIYRVAGLRKTGIAHLFKLGQIDRILPSGRINKPLNKDFFPASAAVIGEVGLFTGCMGRLLDNATIIAAIRVLNSAGYNVRIPELQVCCGALDLHSGDYKAAKNLARKNIAAFSSYSLDTIVTIASGCGATLCEYENSDFADKIIDICQFLHQKQALGNIKLFELSAVVSIHTPCSLSNVMCQEQGVKQVLKKIPGVQVVALPESLNCCGSAGSYVLEHPKMANILLDDLLVAANRQNPDVLVSSNIGCILHIAAGLKEQGSRLEVMHPVVLIARAATQLVGNG